MLTSTIIAQQGVSNNKPEQKVKITTDVLQKYVKISSLPDKERRKFFREVSAEDRSSLFKLHLALALVKRPNLTKEQKEVILEAISAASPEAYETPKTSEAIAKIEQNAQILQQKMSTAFSKQEAFTLFANLGGGQSDISLLENYESISSLPVGERKAIFRNSNSFDKSNLWRLHIVLFLINRKELSKEQKDFILDVLSFVIPETFETVPESPQWKSKVEPRIERIAKEVLTHFSKTEASEMLIKFGDEVVTTSNTLPFPSDCGCHRGIGDLCPTSCVGNVCDSSGIGCGIIFLQSCNGYGCY